MKKYYVSTLIINLFLLLFCITPCYSQSEKPYHVPNGIYEKLFFVDLELQSNFDAYTQDGGHIFFLQSFESFTKVAIEYDNPKRKFFGLVKLSNKRHADNKTIYNVSYDWGQMVTFANGVPNVEPVFLHSPMEYKSGYKIPAGTYHFISPASREDVAEEFVKVGANGTVTYWYNTYVAVNIPEEPAGGRAGGGRGITKVTLLTGGYPVIIKGQIGQNLSSRYVDQSTVKLTRVGKPYTKITTSLNKRALAKQYYFDADETYPKPEDMHLYNRFMNDKDKNHHVMDLKKDLKENTLQPDKFRIYNTTYKIVGITDNDIVLCTTTGDDIFHPGSYRILTRSDDFKHCKEVASIGDSWVYWCNMKVKEEERKREETLRVEKHILEMAKQQEETNRSNEYNIVDKTAKSLHEYILKALRMPGFRNGDSARSFEVDSYYDAWDDILRNFFTLDPNKDEDIEKVMKFKELVESAHTLEISDYNYDDKTLKMRVEIPKRKKTLKYDITFKYSLGSGRFAKFNDIIIELSEDM